MKLTNPVEDLIQRSIDGELSHEEIEQLDRHLATHQDDAALHRKLKRQSEIISETVPIPTTVHLRSLRGKKQPVSRPALRIAASIALLAVGIGIGLFLPRNPGGAPTDLATFANQASAAHSLYVTEVLHPVEVGASEKGHLQAWLSNRLGAAIIAPQLGETGYSLIGGRLLPSGDRAAALFMYENERGDRLSLMATHGGSQQSQSFRFQEKSGYLVVFWRDGPWQYSLVGDRKHKSMGEIARLIHGQMI
ncbi:anti-sigma factor [Pseudophaeobacter sp.]|jgi:anti-sigma factor RsiW|uniref:anti-sigma factor family protein n=1 Tax=Pseudophaeobacter sp. TaxID=1971739 RepID=UPI0032D9160B